MDIVWCITDTFSVGSFRDHDSKEITTFAGLDKKFSSTAFVNNLGMLNALEELNDLSEALQSSTNCSTNG